MRRCARRWGSAMSESNGVLRDLPPPPPPPAIGDELERELGRLEPVSLRRPWIDFAKVLGVPLAYGGAFLALLDMRRDMDTIPMWWIVSLATAWFVGFGSMVYLAVVPRRGAVMPRWRLAGIGAAVVGLGFVVAGLMMDPM